MRTVEHCPHCAGLRERLERAEQQIRDLRAEKDRLIGELDADVLTIRRLTERQSA